MCKTEIWFCQIIRQQTWGWKIDIMYIFTHTFMCWLWIVLAWSILNWAIVLENKLKSDQQKKNLNSIFSCSLTGCLPLTASLNSKTKRVFTFCFTQKLVKYVNMNYQTGIYYLKNDVRPCALVGEWVWRLDFDQDLNFRLSI